MMHIILIFVDKGYLMSQFIICHNLMFVYLNIPEELWKCGKNQTDAEGMMTCMSSIS
jgi:hypothetical protein